ncbi:hypothetical protein Cgig2_012224 [Carnegiea gigantea]|uniref:Uncharacterized protein n=1 Tax=Carnegiea gigantea TaxID=171969 RepID=A0A9Q1KRN2_9CARY|nr:hypothetical protein Cgig2_012224 [Carnegiea gigantea]
MDKIFGNAYRGDPGVPHSGAAPFTNIWIGCFAFNVYTWNFPYLWQLSNQWKSVLPLPLSLSLSQSYCFFVCVVVLLLWTREHPSLLPDPLLKPFHGYLCHESPFQASTTNLQVRISISLPSLLRIFLPLFFFCCFGPFCGLSVAVWRPFLLLLLFLFLFGHVCWPWWCFRPPFSLSPPPIAVGGLGGEWAASSFFFFRAHWAEADLTLSLQRPFFGGGELNCFVCLDFYISRLLCCFIFGGWHDKAFLYEQYHWKKARAKGQPYKFKWNEYMSKEARDAYYYNWPIYFP